MISAPAGGRVECGPGQIGLLLSERRGLLGRVGGGERLSGCSLKTYLFLC